MYTLVFDFTCLKVSTGLYNGTKWVASHCMIQWWPSALMHMGPVSIFNKTSYYEILWKLLAKILLVWTTILLWNLTDISAAVLSRHLSNFIGIWEYENKSNSFQPLRSFNDMPCQILKWAPGLNELMVTLISQIFCFKWRNHEYVHTDMVIGLFRQGPPIPHGKLGPLSTSIIIGDWIIYKAWISNHIL